MKKILYLLVIVLALALLGVCAARAVGAGSGVPGAAELNRISHSSRRYIAS